MNNADGITRIFADGSRRFGWFAWALNRALWVGVLGLLLLAAPVWAQQKVRVGVYQNSPKVAISNTGKPEGVFIDLIEAIAEKEGWQIDYVAGTWAEGLARLGNGEIDLMPDVALTTERESIYAFHQEPVLASWNQVYARRGGGVRSMLGPPKQTSGRREGVGPAHAVYADGGGLQPAPHADAFSGL